jgi:hypothetical protein
MMSKEACQEHRDEDQQRSIDLIIIARLDRVIELHEKKAFVIGIGRRA